MLDLFVFVGPTPAAVVAQYTGLVGRPAMMPYWSLGYHQCRYGYTNVAEVEAVVANMSAAQVHCRHAALSLTEPGGLGSSPAKLRSRWTWCGWTSTT